ncbi:Ig-like domain repeat protein [Oerskovia flava]|uniref:Ig-like domain repeat protein n=1 Tax=Oerskovia flava TaxID=2986422 RepID=UPI00223FDD08|nr:Ig-like domain repeat protein [Oerskovia sp. JB1-3-2]
MATHPDTPVIDDEPVRYDSPLADEAPSGSLRRMSAPGTHTAHVVVVAPGWTSTSQVEGWVSDEAVHDLVDEVSSFWSDQTGGAVSYETGSIERISLPNASCSTTNNILSLWEKAGESRYGTGWYSNRTSGPRQREHLVVLSPYRGTDLGRTTCGGTLGLGTLPSTPSTSSGGVVFALHGGANASQFDDGAHTLAHELGHNKGLEHSGSLWCSGSTNDASLRPLPSSCGYLPYVDSFDVMGTALAPGATIPALSTPGRARLGVLGSAGTTAGAGVRTVDLSPVGGSGSRQSVTVIDPKTKDRYYVEYRSASTPWPGHRVNLATGGLPLRFDHGVRILRLAPATTSTFYQGEQVVLPHGPSSGRTSYLPVGSTFTTRSKAVSVTTRSVGATAKVDIAVRSTPAVTVAASRTGTQVHQDPNVLTMTATVATVGGVVPAGTMTFTRGSMALGRVTVSSTGTATVRLPRSLKVGSHTVTATFVPSSSSSTTVMSASGTRSVRVTKATPTVTAKLAKSTVRTWEKPKVTVTVRATGISRPTGKVSVYVGSRKVRTATLRASDQGRLTITLPASTTRGNQRIKAHFSGNDVLVARWSPRVDLRVV